MAVPSADEFWTAPKVSDAALGAYRKWLAKRKGAPDSSGAPLNLRVLDYDLVVVILALIVRIAVAIVAFVPALMLVVVVAAIAVAVDIIAVVVAIIAIA